MAYVWAGGDDVGLNPSDPAARSQLLERATTLASGFQQLDSTLAGLGASSVEQLQATIAEVNATAGRIAELNGTRSEEHTSELQSLMRTSYAVFCLQKKKVDQYTRDNMTIHPLPLHHIINHPAKRTI